MKTLFIFSLGFLVKTLHSLGAASKSCAQKIVLFLTALLALSAQAEPWTIAIDPGHGGKDPGAISRNMRMYEKNITIAIARELKAFLDKDPNFRAVMTRTGDYYISVPARSEIARSKKANYLVSIHADSSENPAQRGASVWVLSNRRANDEMGQWLEDHEKQSELLGGAGNVLASHNNEKYLNQTVLDLQFGHSQREGYQLGDSILRNFAKITTLSRSRPQHASLGVLRSPDIPSVLVETGFLSNAEEEAKLSSPSYRRRIAYIIYQGIVEYRKRNGGLDVNTTVKAPEMKKEAVVESKPEQEKADVKIKDSGIKHTVKSGEYLNKIAKQYNVKADDIVELNKLKRRELFVGQRLRIPDNGKSAIKTDEKPAEQAKSVLKDSGVKYVVKSGDRLDKIAKQYDVKADDIVELNKLKRRELSVGQNLRIPDNGKSAVKTDEKPAEQAKSVLKDSGVKYVVKSGDRLDKIAKQYDVKADDIVELNKLKRKELFVGQRLRIPDNGKSAVKTDEKPTEQAKSVLKDSGVKYVVKSGDRLDKIAKQYDVKVDDIVELNKLKRKELFVGQNLRIPDNGKSAVKKETKSQAQSDKQEAQTIINIKDSGIVHTVKSGERLDKIAQKYHVSSDEIVALNNLKQRTLRIGDKLKIPAKAKVEKVQQAKSEKAKKVVAPNSKLEATKSEKETKTTKKTNSAINKNTEKSKTTVKFHTVEKNQNLSTIARLHGTSTEKLLKLNPKLKNGKILVGQKIQVKE